MSDMVYVVRCNNSIVTDYYLDIIGEMLSEFKENVENYHDEIVVNKRDIIIVATVIDFIKIYKRGYRKIIFWMQGIEAEESYLNHKSNIRKIVLNMMTKFALRNAVAVFYVSKAMQEYEENKFRIDTKSKSFIMPCFNISDNKEIYFDDNKYKNNVFTYVGSLSKWQCFEETLEFYKEIEKKISNTKLCIYTFEKEKAKKIIEKKEIQNYTVDCVKPDELTEKLCEVKFGFVLRKDIAVNNVATPTKLSSYLSAGVIPIFSECLLDFTEKTKNMQYVIPVNEKMEIPQRLKIMIDSKLDCEKVKTEYDCLFSTYYNPSYYKDMYRKTLYDLLNCSEKSC